MIWSTKKIDLLLTAHRENIADYRSIEPLAELWLLAVPLPYNSYISWHPGGNCWRDQPCFLVNIQDMDSSESRFCWRLGFAVKAKARFFETTTGVGHQKPDYTVAKKAGRTSGLFHTNWWNGPNYPKVSATSLSKSTCCHCMVSISRCK